MEKLIHTSGLILDDSTINESDYIIGASTIKIPLNTNTTRTYYNQYKKGLYRSCGIHMCLGCITDLTGYVFSSEEIEEIVNIAKEKYGLVDGSGMRFSSAVDCVRNWWNNNNKLCIDYGTLSSYRTTIGSDIYEELLEKGHSIAVGYYTSAEYTKDSQDNGIINGNNFGKNGGHGVRTNIKNTPQGIEFGKIESQQIDDNYIGILKYNTYINEDLVYLSEEGIFYKNCFYFLLDSTMEDKILEGLTHHNARVLYKLGYTKGLNPDEAILRKDVFALFMQITNDLLEGKLTKEKVLEADDYVTNWESMNEV